jgi:sugar lactone lactonase YvrE
MDIAVEFGRTKGSTGRFLKESWRETGLKETGGVTKLRDMALKRGFRVGDAQLLRQGGGMNIRTLSALIFTVLILISAVSHAAECPQVDSLPGITMPAQTPNSRSVAADSRTGKIYVTDWFESRLSVYDRYGRGLKSITVNLPNAVAVDSQGLVYVAMSSGLQGEVAVYDGGLNRIGSLGAGLNEFVKPGAIATDADRVYVADQSEFVNRVKIFDINSRQLLASFGGYGGADGNPGTADGDLYKPNGLAISPATGNLFVSDKALWWDTQYSQWMAGAGVHEFTRDGVFVRKFGTYGFTTPTPGVLATPAGVAVDSSGRVYATDSTMHLVQVFAPDGTPVCMLQGISEARGISYARDGRLLVAAANGVRVLGLDNYVFMDVSPLQLSFEGQNCGGAAPTQAITITNSGKGVLNWSITNNNEWLSPASTAGQINGAGSVSVDVSALVGALAEGSYSGSFSVSYQGGSEGVSASLQVVAPPTLSVSPQSLSFAAASAQQPAPQPLDVLLSGDSSGSLKWTATADAAWIGLSPSMGDSNVPGATNVSINSAGLASGHYEGSVTVSACASSVVVPVAFDYAANGVITVTANISEATYTITGPQTFTGSGASSTFGDVPEGTYTITFGKVPGYKEPVSYSQDVAAGQTVDFGGNYRDLRRNLDIAAAPADPQKSAVVRFFDGADGLALGSFTLTDDDRYQSAVAGDVDGDGLDEVIISLSSRLAEEEADHVEGYEADGTPVAGLSFLPDVGALRVNLAAGDVDGDGVDEIIAAAADGKDIVPVVKVFKYEGGTVYDTGISFNAYDGNFGAALASADVDGDGTDEIIAIAGLDSGSLPVGVWKVQGGAASLVKLFWINTQELRTDSKLLIGNKPSVAAGDLDGDATAEIMVSTCGEPGTTQNWVLKYTALGASLGRFMLDSSLGTFLSAGDTDFDGLAEIAVGDGPSSKNAGRVRLYSPDGTVKLEIGAFSSYGAKISLGRFE